jgi:hypothetical protein
MKTSNKLLLALLIFIVICILVGNITLKNRLKSEIKSPVNIELSTNDSTATYDSDSVAMDKAIGNE